METLASNDKRKPFEQIQRIRELRPDMILLAGGTDGGTKSHVVQLAELIAPAKPQPRFGGQFKMPVIYAGNREAVPWSRTSWGRLSNYRSYRMFGRYWNWKTWGRAIACMICFLNT